MSTTISSGPGGTPSVTELVSGIVGDVQDLGMQHLALFRREVKADLQKTADAGVSLAVGLAVAQVGGLLLSLMVVHLLQSLAPGLSLWSCYGIVGALIVALGVVAVLVGVNKLKGVNPLSDQTAQAMKEDAEWLTTPK
jgi:hypothetical protein